MKSKNKGQFPKGNIPWNKNKKGIHLNRETEFKDGQFVGKDHPSWKGGIQKPKKDCRYQWTGNGERVRLPRKIYEEYHGPIPPGYVVVHKDNDKDNDDPDNLIAISRAENLKRNQKSTN